MAKNNVAKPQEPLRVAASLVMDAASLERARAKAAQHQIPFAEYLEEAVRLYGRVLDKKVSVVPRPI
ncbi:MAG: hypothetical protein KJ720_03900 [Proteobacteria bacterium]|nr:hypothetical protein [Pseudomonadota bacterium]MBU1452986.1 hypothetical protein [Pseudomonadota bacterium]